jgi:hypothetical protein
VFFRIIKRCKVEWNLKDGRHIYAEEKLMAYLYMASGRSGTTQLRVANRCQHITSTISKMIAKVAELNVARNVIKAFSEKELLKPSKKITKNPFPPVL